MRSTMSQSQFRQPSPDDPHHVFWAHLKAGGCVWRNDPLNNIGEWLDLAKLEGDPNKIVTYGYTNLSLQGPPIDVTLPLYDSDGYLHIFVDSTSTQIATKQYGLFAIWDATTGKLLSPTIDHLYLSNSPLSEQALAQRKEQGAQLLDELRAQINP